ncbi:hypothetical protein UUU_31400 [Klebsiella pneumoniae subsp. pneumoniae DSM 30104 = JCM 1662 = NBRC 14940]|nr:hypothetical protein UUU_31400 [Klebsiella pneumoniae subsp. pneumoniae DSM 30104 = JCM 1662 = NBRC 14940]
MKTWQRYQNQPACWLLVCSITQMMKAISMQTRSLSKLQFSLSENHPFLFRY